MIPDEGPHIRQCEGCRAAAQEEPWLVATRVTHHAWRRWGVQESDGDDWMDLVDWR